MLQARYNLSRRLRGHHGLQRAVLTTCQRSSWGVQIKWFWTRQRRSAHSFQWRLPSILMVNSCCLSWTVTFEKALLGPRGDCGDLEPKTMAKNYHSFVQKPIEVLCIELFATWIPYCGKINPRKNAYHVGFRGASYLFIEGWTTSIAPSGQKLWLRKEMPATFNAYTML